MRILILMLVGFFVIGNVYSKSYLLVDKATNEVKSLSNEDDAQLEKGWEKIILPQDFADIELTAPASDYKYKNKKLILNIKKISDREIDREIKREKAEKKNKEDKLINERIRKIALQQLIEEGLIKEGE